MKIHHNGDVIMFTNTQTKRWSKQYLPPPVAEVNVTELLHASKKHKLIKHTAQPRDDATQHY